MLVFALDLAERPGRGGLFAALLGAVGYWFSPDKRSAYSSSAADNCFDSSFRSSVHDFDLCFLPNGSGGNCETVALCGIPGLGTLGERGDRACPFGSE